MLRRAFASTSSSAVRCLPTPKPVSRLAFSTAIPNFADSNATASSSSTPWNDAASSPSSPLPSSSSSPATSGTPAASRTSSSIELPGSVLPGTDDTSVLGDAKDDRGPASFNRAPFRLHVIAGRNNTIMTLTNGSGGVVYGCSGGTVGFKSAARGGYEAAYQAALNMFQTIKERHRTDWPNRKHGGIMTRLEIILQGTGPGKDAFRRAIMTDEGATIRYFVSRISDGTKIQIGGVRPKKRRNY